MEKSAKIYVAGHLGLAGSAFIRNLKIKGYTNLLTIPHAKLDLTSQVATEEYFAEQEPDYVFLAAARVGGILANNTYPAEFARDNLTIETNVIHAAWKYNVKRLLFLGSSCIYPRDCPQPIKEDYLLTGPLEATNRPYAVAKIAGIEMCWSYNRQYGTRFLAAMPTNLYGPGDSYDLNNSHVIPALIRKFHEAKQRDFKEVVVWGTGIPRREFLYSDEMADACIYLMNLSNAAFDAIGVGGRGANNETARDVPPLINIGVGYDITIRDLAEIIKHVVGFSGSVVFDSTKPDGTPRKLMDVTRLSTMGWRASIPLEEGLARAYADFISRESSLV